MTQSIVKGPYAEPDEKWLAGHQEDIIDPARPIVDPHHHLWDVTRPRYLLDEVVDDVGSGHNIVATVFVECRSMYRAAGSPSMVPVGEVEFVNGVAAMSASGNYGKTSLCEGIVGFADLRSGNDVRTVLEAEILAGGSRFKGIRHSAAWDADTDVFPSMPRSPKGLLMDSAFRAGFACLAPLGLSYDSFILFPQIPELIDLARSFAGTNIVLDHVGCPIGIGSYASRRDEAFRQWQVSIRELARCENVYVKLGGLGMRLPGFDFHTRKMPPTSEQLAEAWRPYIETCIDAFGPKRSMLESNFPPDKGTCSYQVLWNAFKRLTSDFSESEKNSMFATTAARFYRLPR